MANADTKYRKIILGASGVHGKWDEFVLATAAATPGMNLVPNATARVMGRDTAAPGASPVAAAANAGGQSGALNIVVERALIGETIDTSIAVGETVGTYKPLPGDVIQVLALTGEDIDKEEGIAFNANGKAIAATVGIVAKSLEDTGGALAADTHIRVRVI
jgi:hypothetical protein